MASDNPRGLIPTRSLDGNPTGVTRRFSVSANNPAAIFKGDPVTFFNGHVRVIATSTPSAGEPIDLQHGLIQEKEHDIFQGFHQETLSSNQLYWTSHSIFVDIVKRPVIQAEGQIFSSQ